MIAAKAFDPVVGIDIHIIQPPGPVPPLPVPHPFIGILLDPFDFAPIIGSTVSVNGLPRATAGTGGRCLPPHIPIGGVFVKPPANECDVFMGSSTVLADDEPLSFLGMPALSCHCIGMPPFPRLKKKRSVKSLVLPTTFVIAIPMGMPVLVGGPPTVSMMALGMRAGMAALGKVFKKLRKLQKASRRMRALSDRIQNAAARAMNKLGVPPSVQNRVSRAICSVTGHPVDIATGKVLTESVDFQLHGPIPFRWQRVWYSCSVYPGPLGHGWHHNYDAALCEDEGGVAVRMSDGRSVAFPTLAPGGRSYDRQERLTLERDGAGYRLTTPDRAVLRFHPGDAGRPQPLVSIADTAGNQIRFFYDAGGQLAGIIDSAGRRLTVTTDDGGRITAVLGPGPGDEDRPIALASYRYDALGNLIEAGDALGQVEQYQYDGHLLTTEIGRTGLQFFFEYDRPGPSAQCIRTWGDGGIFGRILRYDAVSRMTWVEDTTGALTTFVSNDLGLVHTIIDAAGAQKRFEWDEHGRKLAETDWEGNEVRWEYDEDGNMLGQRLPSGAETRFIYNEQGLPTAMIAPDGAVWSRGFDSNGLLQFTEDPVGNRFEYRYNSRGQVDAVADPLGRTLRIEYDPQGLPSAEVDWNGGRTSFLHDRLGQLVKITRADGTTYGFVRDAAGRLRRLLRPDGTERHYAYDGAGYLRAVRDERGALWTFEHAFPGRITRRIAPDGTTYEWDYDREGRVRQIRNPIGESAAFERDSAGRVIRERRFDGLERTFTYPTAGQSHDEHWPDGSWVHREIDALGQLVRHVDRSGQSTSFAYDGAGRVVRAENSDAVVSFTYDEAGRLLEEQVETRASDPVPASRTRIRSEYDQRGRRVGRVRDGGPAFAYEYDANGWLNRVLMPSGDRIAIARDALGRPSRTHLPGAIAVDRRYDALGRVVVQEAEGPVPYRRSYHYSPSGEPEQIGEDSRVLIQATVDVTGRPETVRGGDRGALHIPRNGSGDALVGAAGEVLRYDRGGRVRNIGEEEWRYDGRGNVARQTSHGGDRTLSYDGADRLVAVSRGAEQIARYAYDPFGRRLWKRSSAGVTRFVWDGDRVAAEVGPDGPVDYVFEPFSFTPLARVSAHGVEAFHCDHIGTPFLVTDAAGQVTWRADPDLFAGALPRQQFARPQPLRFQGQYADDETGLHYNRHRYYDPRLGRFLSPDPLGLSAGLELYAYVPNPLSWIDPFGLAFERPYTRDEVGDILDDSEGRPSPESGQDGHPRSSHVDVPNADIQARADAPGPPATVTTFEGDSAQTRAATEALNSPEGQAQLRHLDDNPAEGRVRIQTDVSGETLRTARRGQGYITRQTGRSMTVTVIVDVLDRTPGAERIHIQTCYGRY